MSLHDSEIPLLEDALRRNDKWFLGGGRKALWAPEWPLWLDRPGFWDHACYYDLAVQPVFTVTFLNEDGSEVSLDYENRTWVPSHLTQAYTGEGLEITERRALLPDDVLLSDFLITNPSSNDRTVHAVLWTCQMRSGKAEGEEIDEWAQTDRAILLRHRRYTAPDGPHYEIPHLTDPHRLNYEFYLAYGASVSPESFSVHLSEGAPNQPRWELTPFCETFNGRLDNAEKFNVGVNHGGLLYVAQHYALQIPAGGTIDFVVACAFAETDTEALNNLVASTASSDPIQISVDNWEAWFRSVAEFHCSDPYLEQYYWYRWFGLKLNKVHAGTDRLPHPCVYEGINKGWFRHAITYSAQVHMLECKWMHDPELARGTLRNFIAHQREDGSFPGGILTGRAEAPHAFYHANWGKAVRELCALHPDEEFLRETYPALVKYAQYFQRVRDPEQSFLFDVINQGETGQEYMARYLFARSDADDWGEIRLKGVDATVYLYELFRWLEQVATRLDLTEDADHWRALGDSTRDAVRSRMWDAERGFFVDVRPDTYEKCPSLCALGFYPFFTDIATEEHRQALTDHLFNRDEFWTEWPVPSTCANDPTYSAEGEWKEKRMVCPWNGRTWLMTNSHVMDALGRAAQTLDASLKPWAVEFMDKFIRMLFLDRDPKRPSSYEYYNPRTAQAPFFRGTDDYMHSYIVDLILKYVAGVQIEGDTLIVDPLPFQLEHFSADHIPAAGHWVRVTYRTEDGLRVYLDGEEVAHSPQRKRIEIVLNG
jgi:hypothetical protein